VVGVLVFLFALASGVLVCGNDGGSSVVGSNPGTAASTHTVIITEHLMLNHGNRHGYTDCSIAAFSLKSAPGVPQDKPSSKRGVNFDHPEPM
jgi:hypothetical protein